MEIGCDSECRGNCLKLLLKIDIIRCSASQVVLIHPAPTIVEHPRLNHNADCSGSQQSAQNVLRGHRGRCSQKLGQLWMRLTSTRSDKGNGDLQQRWVGMNVVKCKRSRATEIEACTAP